MTTATPPHRSKLFWVALLYFSEGFPLGVFYEIFPVWARQQGVDLRAIGALSLLGLAWTLKFLWAPAIDHYRRHRLWMACADLAMGACMLAFAASLGFGPWVWALIGLFTILSATKDIAIDGYTIEYLNRDEMGIANGVRIGFYRVGMLGSGAILILSEPLGWTAAFLCGAGVFAATAVASLLAPREREQAAPAGASLGAELRRIVSHPPLTGVALGLLLGAVWLADRAAGWTRSAPIAGWLIGMLALSALLAGGLRLRSGGRAGTSAPEQRGPMFGALFALLERPGIVPVLVFILVFKLGDASMGFMVKPFWVDAGFGAAEIGLVSVNIGLALSIAGGLVGGWYADRRGIFRALWVLGLWQALSNLGYACAGGLIPHGPGSVPEDWHRAVIYTASAAESFTGGLGTGAFLAFLMAIVDKRRSAAEYALLSSIFALSRSVAGWAGGYGAAEFGYGTYFLLTFFLSFPAFALLPWARRMIEWSDAKLAPGADASVVEARRENT